VAQVAVANRKLYVNRKDGFVGYGLKKDELVSECSDIDDIIVFMQDGNFIVSKVSEKAYVGKNIIHAAVWNKGNEHLVYNMVYYDAKSGRSYAKRFNVTSIIRDKAYDLTRGAQGSKVLYFTANPNSESEVVSVFLNPASKARKKTFEFDFGELAIKGRGAQGNIITRYPVRRITQKEAGASTLGGRDIFFDENIGRLNTEGRGRQLGTFDNGDIIIAFYQDGYFELSDYDLNNHYDVGKLVYIEKFDNEKTFSALHYDGESKNFYVKRFFVETDIKGRPYKIITEAKGSSLLAVSTAEDPVVELEYLKGRAKEKVTEQLKLNDLVGLKGWKARGNRVSPYRVTYADIQKPENTEVPEESTEEEVKPADAETDSETPARKDDQLGLF
jgi:topoisomerase-4 subunit A